MNEQTCRELLEEWLQSSKEYGSYSLESLLKMRNYISQLLDHCNMWDKPFSELSPKCISDFINHPDGSKLSTRTLKLNTVKAWCRWLSKAKGIQAMPTASINRPKHYWMSEHQLTKRKRKFLTRADVDTLVKLLKFESNTHMVRLKLARKKNPKHNLTGHTLFVLREEYLTGLYNCAWRAVLISYHTGLRMADVCLLKKESLVNGTLTVRARKTRKGTSQQVNEELKELLATPDTNKSPYVLPELAKKFLRQGRTGGIASFFHYQLKKAGLSGYTFHDLRSTALYNRAQYGGVQSAQEMAGHSSSVTTFNYLPEAYAQSGHSLLSIGPLCPDGTLPSNAEAGSPAPWSVGSGPDAGSKSDTQTPPAHADGSSDKSTSGGVGSQ